MRLHSRHPGKLCSNLTTEWNAVCTFRLPSSGLGCGPAPTPCIQSIQFTINLWTPGSCYCCWGLFLSQVTFCWCPIQARPIFGFTQHYNGTRFLLSSTCRLILIGQLSPLLPLQCLLAPGNWQPTLNFSARQSFLFFMCVCVPHACLVAGAARRGVGRFPGTGDTHGCECYVVGPLRSCTCPWLLSHLFSHGVHFNHFYFLL